jgi:hypothetical protein
LLRLGNSSMTMMQPSTAAHACQTVSGVAH